MANAEVMILAVEKGDFIKEGTYSTAFTVQQIQSIITGIEFVLRIVIASIIFFDLKEFKKQRWMISLVAVLSVEFGFGIVFFLGCLFHHK